MAKYRLLANGVMDTERAIFIPADPRNSDWQNYQNWLSSGVPDPLIVPAAPTPAEIATDRLQADPALRGLVKVLATRFGLTPQQVIDAIKAAA